MNLSCKKGKKKDQRWCLFYSGSCVQYALLLYYIYSAFLPSDRTHVVSLLSPHTSFLLFVCEMRNATRVHWNIQAACSSYTLAFNRLQRPLFSIWLYLLRHHLKITSASFHSLLSPRLPPWGSERFSGDGKQSAVCSISGREGYWNSSAVISYVVSAC